MIETQEVLLVILAAVWGGMAWYGFRIGEAPTSGSWVKKQEHPRFFWFVMSMHLAIFTMIVFVLIAVPIRRGLGFYD